MARLGKKCGWPRAAVVVFIESLVVGGRGGEGGEGGGGGGGGGGGVGDREETEAVGACLWG